MGSEWVPSVVRLFADAIGWVGAIVLLLVLRNFIVYGISAVLRDAIVNASSVSHGRRKNEKLDSLATFFLGQDVFSIRCEGF